MVYTALLLAANAAAADPAALREMRAGDMRALVIHDTPRALPAALLLDADDAEHPLEDWRGRWLVLNFWATWCPPCRDEMPALDALEGDLGGDGFAVLPVATGRNPLPAIRRFYAEAGLDHLPILRDPRQRLASEMGVFGLPVTVLVDPGGHEVARLTGDADWNGPAARRILEAMMAQGPADPE